MKPYLEILKLVWPIALGMMNNAILQFTDRAFLAHESMASLEASLPASMLAYVTLGFFQSVVAYSGTFVAQYHGAGRADMCRLSYLAGTLIALVSGALALLALPLGDLIFTAFANGPEVMARQKAYFNICTAGGVFLFGQMAVQSYFTGLGRTRIVLWVNIIGNAVNVAIDPVLIFGWFGCPKLGISGAAYATVFATAVQWAILAAAARRITAKAADRRERLLPLLAGVVRFGVPAGAYSVLNSVSFTVFVFFTGAVGHIEAAVSNAAFSVCYVLFAPMEGFAIGAQTLVGHARGRGDDAAAMKTGFRTLTLGVTIAVVLSVAIVILRHPVLSIYAPGDPAAAEFHRVGSYLFFLMAAWQVFDAADVIMCGALRGAGDTKFVMWWMFLVAFVFWMPMVAVVAAVHNTMPALWCTMIIYVVVICVGSVIRWRCGRWKRIRIF
ncbi:MAG: MATE family efflux transporter [Kiritimatiellae bacterium]|nr:MATE family efflux transporter [Kiritimatiellia bacterium]